MVGEVSTFTPRASIRGEYGDERLEYDFFCRAESA